MTKSLSKWAIPALAVLGLADSLYLTVLHLQDVMPPCGAYAGCADVNTSPYAEMFGLPVAGFGAALYLALLGLGLFRMRARGQSFLWATMVFYALTVSGAVFMTYLTVVELFVLQAVCYWCVALAAITFLLLVLAVGELRLLEGKDVMLSRSEASPGSPLARPPDSGRDPSLF